MEKSGTWSVGWWVVLKENFKNASGFHFKSLKNRVKAFHSQEVEKDKLTVHLRTVDHQREDTGNVCQYFFYLYKIFPERTSAWSCPWSLSKIWCALTQANTPRKQPRNRALVRRGLESASRNSAISHLVPGSTSFRYPRRFCLNLAAGSRWSVPHVRSALADSLYTNSPVASVSGQARKLLC